MQALVERPLHLEPPVDVEQLAQVIPFPVPAEVRKEPQRTPEAELLFWIHAAAYELTRIDANGDHILTHRDDERFKYIVDYDDSPETGARVPYLKLSANPEPTFVHHLPEPGYISRGMEVDGRRQLAADVEILPSEIIAIGDTILTALQGYDYWRVVANIV